MENQRMYKVPEFAAALNISLKTVWAHIYTGKLAVVRISSAVRIKQSELDRLVNGMSPKMIERYSHILNEAKRKAVEVLDTLTIQ
jgi:hypothetical protein